jgi:hypothetical protein
MGVYLRFLTTDRPDRYGQKKNEVCVLLYLGFYPNNTENSDGIGAIEAEARDVCVKSGSVFRK